MPTEPEFDSISAAWQLVDRALWVVTAATAKRRGGLLASFVMRSSIDPHVPQVLIGLAPNHFTCELVDGARRFGLHLLAHEQLPLAWRFAIGSSRDVDRFAGLDLVENPLGPPLLADCVARFDCQVFGRWSTGDRVYWAADITAGGLVQQGQALTERDLFAAANDEQRAALLSGLAADQTLHESLRALWRQGQAHLP